MAGKKEMNLELAEKISRSIGLSESEWDYLFLLVLYSKAGTASLKAQLKRKIEGERSKSQIIGERLKVGNELTEEARSTFYSSWIYAGVRNLAAIKKFASTEAIAQHLSLPRAHVQEVIHFLLETGLCRQETEGLHVGPRRTHVRADSPHVQKHHQNWRLQGFQKMPLKRDKDLFFTFPMSLSEKDAARIRKMLPAFAEEVHKIVEPSASETVRCLNIDFFEY